MLKLVLYYSKLAETGSLKRTGRMNRTFRNILTLTVSAGLLFFGGTACFRTDSTESGSPKAAETETGEEKNEDYFWSIIEPSDYIDAVKAGMERRKPGLALMLAEAEEGKSEAQLGAALFFYMSAPFRRSGEAFDRDLQKAFQYASRCADQGDLKAEFTRGYLYYNGLGVKQNYAEALTAYKKCLKSPALYRYACLCLGDMYRMGLGTAADEAEAFIYYSKCSDTYGFMMHKLDAGRKALDDFYYGSFTEKTENKAELKQRLKVLKERADKGDLDSMYGWGCLHYELCSFDESDQEHLSLLIKAAENGSAEAQYKLGKLYSNSVLIYHNPHEAVRWLTEAARQDKAPAIADLAAISLKGLQPIKEQPDKAAADSTKSIQEVLDSLEASKSYEKLGNMYYKGEDVAKDIVQAYKYYVYALDRFHPEGLGGYINCYFKDRSCDIWLSPLLKKAEAEDAEAEFALGRIYEEGLGVESDEHKAEELYAAAYAHGSLLAGYRLGGTGLYGKNKTAEDYRKALSYLWEPALFGSNCFGAFEKSLYALTCIYKDKSCADSVLSAKIDAVSKTDPESSLLYVVTKDNNLE